MKSKKAEITNYYYIEQSWSVSLKNIGRQNFVYITIIGPNPIQPNPIHGWIQSMDISEWDAASQAIYGLCPIGTYRKLPMARRLVTSSMTTSDHDVILVTPQASKSSHSETRTQIK